MNTPLRATTVCLLAACLLLVPAPVRAGDEEPSLDELARMILEGNDAEHALVARWLEGADRATLRSLFGRLRARRAAGTVAPTPTPTERKPRPDEPLDLIHAELRVIDVPARSAAAFFGKHYPTSSATVVALTQTEAAALLAKIEKDADAGVVTAPRLTVHDRQKANVSVQNQVSYIQDYDVQVGKDGSVVADPIVAVVQEGVLIDLVPSLRADPKRIHVDFQGTFATLHKPIAEKQVQLPGLGDKPVTIQLPELDVSRLKASVLVEDGGWALVGGGIVLAPEKGRPIERLTLLHLKHVRLRAGDLPAPGDDLEPRPDK